MLSKALSLSKFPLMKRFFCCLSCAVLRRRQQIWKYRRVKQTLNSRRAKREAGSLFPFTYDMAMLFF
jgi:hypothetical protein